MEQKLKRYTPIHSEREMLEHYEGDYVKYSDIEPLIEAVKFYGSVDTWIDKEIVEGNLFSWSKKHPHNDVSIVPYSIGTSNGNFHCLGKKAREVLKKIGVIP